MTNEEMLRRSRHAVWHPCTQMKQLDDAPLIPIQRAQGVWLYDYDGRRYLDGISSWWVNLFGHGHLHIVEALKSQLDALEHVMLAGLTHEPVITLSEKLSELTPGKLGHCFYGSDGASAVEIALKMSFHYWRNAGRPEKSRFVSLANSYHGETIGALSVTDVALFKDVYAPLLRRSAQVPSPDWRLAEAGESPREFALRMADVLDHFLAEHHDEVAALIVEPLVQGAVGMGMYDAAYLSRAREICDRHDVHLIADEIAVGFGRTGTLFACEQAGIAPDFLCLSKGLTGGYLPLSVVLTHDAVFDAFYDDETARGFLHSHSYTGNALACRAALATLEIFERTDVIEENKRRAEHINRLSDRLRQMIEVRNFRNRGMIWAFDVDASDGFARRFYREGLARGLMLRPIGRTVYWMPPYVLTDEESEWLVENTATALNAAL